jgi:NADPH:quinone reductase-like Zn-dependent oxidoreductase
VQSYRLERFGSLDGLVSVQEEAPEPAAGEVLVRVKASSLNFRDLAILMGWSPFPVQPGRIPLSDAAGEVEAVGAGVTRFKAGDRVVDSFYPTWFGGERLAAFDFYGTERDGWLTEYKVVSAESLILAPPHLTFEEAATLPCAGVTAWSALAGVGPGDTVLTQGTGGVSLFALQLAKVLGARVIATTSSAGKAERLKALGADSVIDYVANPEWADTARALTDGRGVDRIVEVGGPGTLAQSIKAVKYAGHISLVGALAAGSAGMDFMKVFMSQATYQCIGTGSRSDLEELCRVLAAHAVHPVIDRVFSLDEAKAAWTHFADRRLFGKVVIRHPASQE